MKTKINPVWLILGVSVWLSACTAGEGSDPAQLLAKANNDTLAADSRYNFSGAAYLRPPEKTAGDGASKKEIEQGDINEKSPLQNFIEYGKFKYSGAIDMPGRRVEIIPEIEYKTQTAQSVTRFPVQIDLSARRVIADISGYRPVVLGFMEPGQVSELENSNYIAYTVPKLLWNKWPAAELLKALKQSNTAWYTKVEPSSISTQPVDDYGIIRSAHSRIHLRTSRAEEDRLSAAAMDVFVATIEKEMAVLPAQNTDKRQILEKIVGVVKELQKTSADSRVKGKNEGFGSTCDYYLDARKRLVASRCRIHDAFTDMDLSNLPDAVAESLKVLEGLDLIFEMDFDYTTPHFSIPLRPEHVLEIKEENIQSLIKMPEAFSGSSEDPGTTH